MRFEGDFTAGRGFGVLLGLIVAVALLAPAGAAGAQAEGGLLETGLPAVANQLPAVANQVAAPAAPVVEQVAGSQTGVPVAIDQTVKRVTAPVEPVAAEISRTVDQTTASVAPVVRRTADEVTASVAPVVRGASETITGTAEKVSAPTAGLIAKSVQSVDPRQAVSSPGAAAAATLGATPAATPAPPRPGAFSVSELSSLLEPVSHAVGGVVAGLGSAGTTVASLTEDTLGSSEPAQALLDVVGIAGSGAVNSMLAASGSAGGGIGLATLVLFSLAVAVGAYRFSVGGLLSPSAPFVLLSERPG